MKRFSQGVKAKVPVKVRKSKPMVIEKSTRDVAKEYAEKVRLMKGKNGNIDGDSYTDQLERDLIHLEGSGRHFDFSDEEEETHDQTNHH